MTTFLTNFEWLDLLGFMFIVMVVYIISLRERNKRLETLLQIFNDGNKLY